MPIQSDQIKRKFAAEMMKWLEGIPEKNHDWAEALVAASLDETQGDLMQALNLAKVKYQEEPEPELGE